MQDKKEEVYNKLAAKINEACLNLIGVKNATDMASFLENVTETELDLMLMNAASVAYLARSIKITAEQISDRPYHSAK